MTNSNGSRFRIVDSENIGDFLSDLNALGTEGFKINTIDSKSCFAQLEIDDSGHRWKYRLISSHGKESLRIVLEKLENEENSVVVDSFENRTRRTVSYVAMTATEIP